MDHLALKAELVNEFYAALSHEDAAAAVNAKTVTMGRQVHSGDIRAVLFKRGKWVGIVKQANAARLGTDVSDSAALCQVIYDLASSGASVDMTDSGTANAVNACLSALMAASVLTADDVAALLALASAAENWAGRHLGSHVTPHDVVIARNL
jgi:hypothetical protein